MSGIRGRLLAVFIFLLIVVPACSDSEQQGSEGEPCTDEGLCLGDLVCQNGTCVSSEDSGVAFGMPCAANDECASGLCTTADGASFCSTLCATDSDCTVLVEDACCGASNYCLPAVSCGTADGDFTDGDTVDGDSTDGDTCENGTLRCMGNDVQICGVDGGWSLYKDCTALDGICRDGVCLEPGDGDVSDGDATDGDATDGDVTDGDATDGDEPCVPCSEEEPCDNDLEYCFYRNPGAQNGCCAGFCDLPGFFCPQGFSCEGGRCEPIPNYCESDGQCDMNEFCYILPERTGGVCKKPCYEIGENCPANSRCIENPQDEFDGWCIRDENCTTCSYDGECGAGNYCAVLSGQAQGCCEAMCGNDSDCPGVLGCCPDGRCAIDCGGQCECEPACAPPYVCDGLYCMCTLPCPQCPEGKYCDQFTAPNCADGPCENPAVCGIGLRPCCFGYNCNAVIYGFLGYCI